MMFTKNLLILFLFVEVYTENVRETEFNATNFLLSSVAEDVDLTINDKLYYVSEYKETYFGAAQSCRNRSMKLATIYNKKENDDVHKILSRYRNIPYFWIAGNRLHDLETWKWEDGTPITYFNWNDGEPNHVYYNEDCLAVYNKAQAILWYDDPCDEKHPFICEERKKMDSSAGEPVSKFYIYLILFSVYVIKMF